MHAFEKLPNQHVDQAPIELREEYHALLVKGIIKASEGIYSYPYAIQFYKQAQQMRPIYFLAYLLHVNVYMNWKKHDLAIAQVDKMFEKANETMTPSLRHCFEGTKLELQGKLEEATAKFKLAIELDRTNYYAMYNYANILDDTGKSEESLPYFEIAASIATYSPCFSFNSMGWVYQNLGKLDEAEIYYKKAIEATPTFLAAIYNLASLYTKELNRIEQAKELYIKAKEIDLPDALNELGNVYYLYESNLKVAREYYMQSIHHDAVSNLAPYMMLAHVELEIIYRALQKKKSKNKNIDLKPRAKAAIDWLNKGIHLVLDPEDTLRLVESKKGAIDELKDYKLFSSDIDSCPENMKYCSSRYRVQMMNLIYSYFLKANWNLEYTYYHFQANKCNYFTDIKII